MKTAALLAIAGLAGAAQAQSITWMAQVSDTEIMPGESVDVLLSASYEAPGFEFVGFAAAIFEVLSGLNGANGEITSWQVQDHLADLTGDLTTTNGFELFNVNAGQLTFLEFSTDNPIDVLAFTWQANAGGMYDVEYSTNTLDGVLWVGTDIDNVESLEVEANEATFGWTVVPTPASAALLGLGGLALARRRR